MTDEGRSWLLLIHQLPPKPDYFRVKVWRRLQRLGAVAIKNSVYVLPDGNQAHEDFQWVLREIVMGGGEGSICRARFIDGLPDAQIESLFHAARDADYVQIADEARRLLDGRGRRPAEPGERPGPAPADLARLRRRRDEVAAIDFLGSPGRTAADEGLASVEAHLKSSRLKGAPPSTARRAPGGRVRGRTWVTRRDIHVDRIASAWLIRRFIDPRGRLKFVAPTTYRPRPRELRFDMFEAEYTHQGDRCTFEVLLEQFGLKDPALRALSQIVHDIDLKDAKFGRDEADGIARLIDGLARATPKDEERAARGAVLFDDLYESFRRSHA